MNLSDLIHVADSLKPEMGKSCNNCGWCCLTEVCSVGIELTGSSVIPCSLLAEREGKHYCLVAGGRGKDIGIGTGCDAQTQQEILDRLRGD